MGTNYNSKLSLAVFKIYISHKVTSNSRHYDRLIANPDGRYVWLRKPSSDDFFFKIKENLNDKRIRIGVPSTRKRKKKKKV